MELIKLIQSFSNPFLDMLFQLITMLGEDNFFMLVTAVIYWCISKEMGYRLGFICLTSAAVNQALKDVFRVPRIIGENGIRSLRVHTAEGFSFPSGHTQSTTSFWVFLMTYFKKLWLYAAGGIVIAMVGLSRMYLGVHTPVDILGGISIGMVWVFLWNNLDEISKVKGKAVYLVVIIPMLFGMLAFPENSNYHKVAGGLLGLYAGYIIEPKYINFKVEASAKVQAIKLTFGLITLLVIRFALKLVLPDVPLSHFFRYFVLVVWMTIAAPGFYMAIDRKLGGKRKKE